MNKRLKYCINNVLESLNDMEKCLKIYNSTDNDDFKQMSISSIRMSIVMILEEYKKIIQILYKSKSKAITPNDSFLESIKFCMKEGMMPNCDISIFKLLRDFRNYSCHRYKCPGDKEIIGFCENINVLRGVTEGVKGNNTLTKSNSFDR